MLDQDFQTRLPGSDLVTYMGIPLNAEARAVALSYTPDNISDPNRQCVPWSVHYMLIGPGSVEIWPTKRTDGTVLAWNIGGTVDALPVTIWMDGRPAPSRLGAHTTAGFATGRWMGETLVATITNIQDGYLTRNGVPSSNEATVTLFITRRDDTLTITGVIRDPVYLTAPYILSAVMTTNSKLEFELEATMGATCTPQEESPSTLEGRVPSYLETPADILMTATERHGIPHEAALGGQETMYPEYIKKIAEKYQPPAAYCTRQCCGTSGELADGRPLVEYVIRVLQCSASE